MLDLFCAPVWYKSKICRHETLHRNKQTENLYDHFTLFLQKCLTARDSKLKKNVYTQFCTISRIS